MWYLSTWGCRGMRQDSGAVSTFVVRSQIIDRELSARFLQGLAKVHITKVCILYEVLERTLSYCRNLL